MPEAEGELHELIDKRSGARKQKDGNADDETAGPNEAEVIVDVGQDTTSSTDTDAANLTIANSNSQALCFTRLKTCCTRLPKMPLGFRIVIGIVIVILIGKAITTSTETFLQSPEPTPEQKSYVPDRNHTRAPPTFTFSICFNGVMQNICNNGALKNSSIQLICNFLASLTSSSIVNPSLASQGKDYEQLCKFSVKHGIKGAMRSCHACLDYNSSDKAASVLRDTECFFEKAINQDNHTYDEASPYLELRSSDPERWARRSHLTSTDTEKLIFDALSFKYRPGRSAEASVHINKQSICNKFRQCSDTIYLHTTASEEGPPDYDSEEATGEGPPVCGPEKVMSSASNKQCLSVEDWLGAWLNCCP